MNQSFIKAISLISMEALHYMVFMIIVNIQHIDSFQLPTALAGGIGSQYALALAKKYAILAKANKNQTNFIPLAKARGN